MSEKEQLLGVEYRQSDVKCQLVPASFVKIERRTTTHRIVSPVGFCMRMAEEIGLSRSQGWDRPIRQFIEVCPVRAAIFYLAAWGGVL